MAKLGDLTVRIGANTKDLNKKLGRVQRNMRSMTGNITKLGKSMSTSITLPLALLAGASLKVAVAFEASMAKVKAVSGATNSEFKSLEETAKRLGATTVFTASAVSDMMLEYAKVGFTTSQINDAAEATLYLAQATGSDLAQAANVAAATLGGFGLAASETGRVADVMAKSFNTSALDIQLFQDSMKYVAPVAKKAGLSLEETTAMLGALAKSGIKGSQAGTSLRKILGELDKGSGTLTEKFAKLNKKGLDLAGAQAEVGASAKSALLILLDAPDLLKEYTEGLLDSAGAAKATADVMNDTTEGALKAMGSALEGVAIVIGDALAPLLRKAADFVADLATKFRELEPGTQKIVIVFAALLASLGPMLLILPQILAALPLMAAAFTAMTGPIGLAVGAVVLLVGTITALVKANKDIPSTLEKANASVREHSTEVRYLVGQYKDETKSLEERKKILGRLAEIDATHFGNLKAENTKYTDLVTNLDAYTASLRRNFLEKALEGEGVSLFAQLSKDESAIRNQMKLIQQMEDAINDAKKRGKKQPWQVVPTKLPGKFGEILESPFQALKTSLENMKRARDQDLIDIDAYEKNKQELLEKYAIKTGPVIPNIEDDDPDPKKKKLLDDLPTPGSLNDYRRNVDLLTAKINNLKQGSDMFMATQLDLAEATKVLDEAIASMSPTLKESEDDVRSLLWDLTHFGEGVEDTAEKVSESVRTMADDINDAISSGVASMISGVAEMVGTAIGAQKPIENMGAFLGNALGQMAINLGTYAIAHGTVIELIKKSLLDLGGVKTVLAGIALVALGAGIKGHISRSAENAGIPLAEGGLIYGPTRAIVGDNKNAQIDPEVVAPLSKLKGMLGGNSVRVYGRISGDDIVLSNSRASRDRNRF